MKFPSLLGGSEESCNWSGVKCCDSDTAIGSGLASHASPAAAFLFSDHRKTLTARSIHSAQDFPGMREHHG